MKLSREQVVHVAALARLGLSEAEIEKFQTQLSNILDYVEQLNEVNTDGIEPTAQVTGLKNIKRKDIIIDSKGKDALADPDKLIECSPLPVEKRQIKAKHVF